MVWIKIMQLSCEIGCNCKCRFDRFYKDEHRQGAKTILTFLKCLPIFQAARILEKY